MLITSSPNVLLKVFILDYLCQRLRVQGIFLTLCIFIKWYRLYQSLNQAEDPGAAEVKPHGTAEKIGNVFRISI